MVKVKICANKSVEEAKMCLDAGADIIGILVSVYICRIILWQQKSNFVKKF